MNISNTQIDQIALFCTYTKESILSNKQILAGIAIQGVGTILQHGKAFYGDPKSTKREIAIVGMFVQIIGACVTGLSKEQTTQKSRILIITGIALMAIGIVSEKTEACFIVGLPLALSGFYGSITVKEAEAARQNLATQPLILTDEEESPL